MISLIIDYIKQHALLQEKAGDANHRIQQTARIAAQVEDNTRSLLVYFRHHWDQLYGGTLGEMGDINVSDVLHHLKNDAGQLDFSPYYLQQLRFGLTLVEDEQANRRPLGPLHPEHHLNQAQLGGGGAVNFQYDIPRPDAGCFRR